MTNTRFIHAWNTRQSRRRDWRKAEKRLEEVKCLAIVLGGLLICGGMIAYGCLLYSVSGG